MFEFVKFPEHEPEESGYYYTYVYNTQTKFHEYGTRYWSNDHGWGPGPIWDFKNTLGFIPESRQDEWLTCVYWSSDNKVKPFE